MYLTPSSWGSSLREANDCHEPAGKPTGGQFCSGSGSGLGETEITYEGVLFKTGAPVDVPFIRRKSGASERFNFGEHYGQDIEPAGRYLLFREPVVAPRADQEHGTVRFKNPLVLVHGGYGPEGWKARLTARYKKRGRALSAALRRAGYDAVVTVDRTGRHPSMSEIVDLTGGR